MTLLTVIIAKEQLTFSQQVTEEYISLRKWNHDIENHLLSLAYLMDMENFKETKQYIKSSLS